MTDLTEQTLEDLLVEIMDKEEAAELEILNSKLGEIIRSHHEKRAALEA